MGLNSPAKKYKKPDYMSICNIELLPNLPNNSLIDQINKLIRESIYCRGLIAFWSINYELLDKSFLEKIRWPGFLCVDIHRPTNVYSICSMANRDASVFFHLYEIKGQSEPMGTFGVHDHLMHSKLWIFYMPGGEVKILIGSHNGTNRAILGMNIESSVLIHADMRSKIYHDVESFAYSVQSKCKPVDPHLLDYYKWLQGESNDRSIIEVFDPQNILGPGTRFALFIKNKEDVQGLQKVGNDVFISVTTTSGDELFYKAIIGQSGELGNYPSMGDVDKHAVRELRQIPTIKNSKPDEAAKNSAYCVVFKLEEPLPLNIQAVELNGDKWNAIEEIPICDEYVKAPELMKVQRKRTKKPKITISEATPSENFKNKNRQSKTRLNDTDRPLITKVSIIKNNE